ncbi:MAG: PIN domain-containing protein [Candidatus Dormibacteria bacterium]
MNTVLDAFAVIAALTGEPAAAEVEAVVRAGDACISAVNLAEVIDQLVRVAGRSAAEVEISLASLAAGGLVVVPTDEQVGRSAGSIRARYYDRRTAPVSLADCVALATCLRLAAALATADAPLATIAKKEGVALVGLPNSFGQRP